MQNNATTKKNSENPKIQKSTKNAITKKISENSKKQKFKNRKKNAKTKKKSENSKIQKLKKRKNQETSENPKIQPGPSNSLQKSVVLHNQAFVLGI